MRQVYIAEDLGLDDLAKVQDESKELGWEMTKMIMPTSSVGARRQWVKNAEEWVSAQCAGSCVGLAYLDDGLFYVRFEESSDSAMFGAASRKF